MNVGLPLQPLRDRFGSAYNARAEPRGRQAGNLTGRREGGLTHCIASGNRSSGPSAYQVAQEEASPQGPVI